jgi:hypothetical protein
MLQTDTSTRRCPCCEQTKPVIGGFYKGSGRTSVYCRDCSREKSRAYARSGQRCSEDMRRYAEANRERMRTLHAQERQRYPTHKAARRAAHYAIRTGRLVRPDRCELCDQAPGVDRLGRTLLRADHHLGYAREHWLDVRFVCPTCDGLQIRAANDAKRLTTLPTPEAVASSEAL